MAVKARKKRHRHHDDPAGTTGLSDALSSAYNIPLPDTVVYVRGSRDASWGSAARDFPLIHWQKGEAESAHQSRDAQLVDEAIAAGVTHLLVRPILAGWLGVHAWMVEVIVVHHEVALASPETGIVCKLCPGRSS